ncbi:BTB/POZ and MATH domain-containing protein 2-like [Oryza brachyantha]|uniref:BTB domain-containing protein n=1 Tax=Oryza brachyantha TaxID=4533 RepID=J3LY05_ORYBR|nr:BTB/POZ and MATH domain-containing protein 2-like [Oryza brachyantha]
MPTDTGSTVARSASAIVSSTESAQHLLKIDGYHRIKDAVATGSCVQSSSFCVGGYNWRIYYYPNGGGASVSDSVSVRLVLATYVNQPVRARFALSLLDQALQPAPSYTYRYGAQAFSGFSSEGPWRFVQKAVLERSPEHLRDDCLSIRCDLTVIKAPEAKDIKPATTTPAPPPPSPPVSVPPSDLTRHLGGLLSTGVGADVAFEVDGKVFAAHRSVLVARSPVLHAELFATQAGKEYQNGAAGVVVRIIDDMEAQDFEALLHFMYTDSLPETMGGGDMAAMLPDLVAAARRYKMERLRLVCEDKLCEHVNVRTVAAMLAFAGEHRCEGLKKKCLQLLDDPANLRKIVETEGLEHLTRNYPFVLKDLIAKLAMKL